MTGNQAIARGAWEAGVKVAAAYPGTPSTEILETVATYAAADVHAQWSPNEKVAPAVSRVSISKPIGWALKWARKLGRFEWQAAEGASAKSISVEMMPG